MKPHTISFDDLPVEAQNKISEDQKSYIDEFSFYWFADDNIEAWYAGEILSVWDGKSWA